MGLEWQSRIETSQTIADTAEQLTEAIRDIECPGGAILGGICAAVKNVALPIVRVVAWAADKVAKLLSFIYGDLATIGNVEPFQMWENLEVVYENMEATGRWLEGAFDGVLTSIESSKTDVLGEIAKNTAAVQETTKDAFALNVEYVSSSSSGINILVQSTFQGLPVNAAQVEVECYDAAANEFLGLTKTTETVVEGGILILDVETKAECTSIYKVSAGYEEGDVPVARTVMKKLAPGEVVI